LLIQSSGTLTYWTGQKVELRRPNCQSLLAFICYCTLDIITYTDPSRYSYTVLDRMT
jgi:hypothetical protein